MAAALDAALLAGGAAQSTAWLGAASAAELQHLLLAAGWCGVVTCAFTAWVPRLVQKGPPAALFLRAEATAGSGRSQPAPPKPPPPPHRPPTRESG